MSLNFNVRESYDRRLSILKRRIAGMNTMSPKKEYAETKEQFSITQEEIMSEGYAAHTKREGQPGYVNHFTTSKKWQGYVRLFISQIKKNSSNTMSEKRVASNKMTREIDRLYNISYQSTKKGWKGIK